MLRSLFGNGSQAHEVILLVAWEGKHIREFRFSFRNGARLIQQHRTDGMDTF